MKMTPVLTPALDRTVGPTGLLVSTNPDPATGVAYTGAPLTAQAFRTGLPGNWGDSIVAIGVGYSSLGPLVQRVAETELLVEDVLLALGRIGPERLARHVARRELHQREQDEDQHLGAEEQVVGESEVRAERDLERLAAEAEALFPFTSTTSGIDSAEAFAESYVRVSNGLRPRCDSIRVPAGRNFSAIFTAWSSIPPPFPLRSRTSDLIP